jgi:hypothetical protein
VAAQPLPSFDNPHDQRKAQRSVTVFALGKLTADGRETPCFIRDRSEGGVRIESDEVLPVESWVTIEMRGLCTTRASVRWCRGGFMGLEFRPTPEQALQSDPRSAPRGPRFAFNRPVVFQTDHSRFDVEALDLAIGGMKLKTGFTMSPRVLGTIIVPGHDIALPAVVAWSRGGTTGVRFVTRLPMERLFKLLTPPA